MGQSLEQSGRDIVYSCSWPAYLGSNESTKPYADMIKAGCNLWRNWDDIQCSWSSLVGIIEHYGDYSKVLQQWAAPGHFNGRREGGRGNWIVFIPLRKKRFPYLSSFPFPPPRSPLKDPDMLLIGNTCISDAEARTQLAIWSILAAPLIMGNDLRTVADSARAILLNAEAIAVDQGERRGGGGD